MNGVHCRVLLLGLLAAAGPGCEGGRSGAVAAVVRDSAGIRIVENHGPIWSADNGWKVDPSPSVIIGVVDGDRNNLLDGVRGAARLSDGRILVVNAGTAELRFYGSDGRFMTAVGGRGGGPGEFGRIPFQLLRTPGDTLVVLDMPSWGVVRFDDQGTFLDRRQMDRSVVTAAVPPGSFSEGVSLLPDGGLMAPVHEIPPRPEPTGHRRPGGYLVVGAEGRTALLEPFPYTDFSSIAFGRSSVFAIGGERLALGDNAAYYVSIYTLGGELTQRIRNMRPNRLVQSEDLEAVRERLIQSAQSPEQTVSWANAFDAANHAETFPAFSALFIDRTGHLWVRHPRPVRGDVDSPVGWDIYNPEGFLLGEVTLPVGLNLHDVGEDYILGVRFDPLGVERVQLHRLTRR